MSEIKLCPFLMSSIIPLLGKISGDTARDGMACKQEECAMWRVFEPSDRELPGQDVMHYRVCYCGLAGKP